MNLDRDSPTAAGHVIKRLLPNPRIRGEILRFFADSVRRAAGSASGCWSVTLHRHMVRLNVGRIEALAIFHDSLHVVAMSKSLPEDLDGLRGVEFHPRARTLYRTVRGSTSVDITPGVFPAVRPLVETSHHSLIERAAATATRGLWAKSHSSGVLRYLEARLRTTLPDPSYWISEQQPPVPDVDDEAYCAPEGRRIWAAHFRVERNRELVARKKHTVLAESGTIVCEACAFNFTEFYRPHAENFCEVHHRKPLVELKEGTRTKLEDLAILCSNCHRVIHLIRPMPSVQSLRIMIRQRNRWVLEIEE